MNQVNIDKLPEDDVPECLWATIERSEDVADAEAERIGLSSDPLEDAVARGEHNVSSCFPMSVR